MTSGGDIWGSVQDCRGTLERFCVFYGAWLTVAMGLQLPGHIRFVRARANERGRVALLGRGRLPRLRWEIFLAVGTGLVASLAIVATGWANPAAALLAAAGLALIYFPQVVELPDVRRKPNTVPLILLLAGAARLAATGPVGTIACACLFTCKLVVAQVYLSSGLMKLKRTGLRWAEGGTLRLWFVQYHLRHGTKAALWLARRESACRLLSALVLGFELTFWLMIPFPCLAWVYLPLGLAFHAGTAILMRIHYWIYLVPAYLLFSPF